MSDRMNDRCCQCGCKPERRRGGVSGLFKAAITLMLIYGSLVFGSGTLMNTGHPVAVEAGRLIQVVTFVEPTINWVERVGHPILASGLTRLASGVEIG